VQANSWQRLKLAHGRCLVDQYNLAGREHVDRQLVPRPQLARCAVHGDGGQKNDPALVVPKQLQRRDVPLQAVEPLISP